MNGVLQQLEEQHTAKRASLKNSRQIKDCEGKKMTLLLNEVLSSIVQVILFTLIPFIWWMITARKNKNFFEWIGLKRIRTDKKSGICKWIICTIIIFEILGFFELSSLKDVSTATSAFSGVGISALPAILIYAIFHTSLSEEILFRGFLLKRFQNKFGFQTGNFVQALLFGLLHGALFINEAGATRAILLIAFTGAVAWTMGYLNEKKASGSLFPGWIIHGTTNIISGLISALL